MSRPVGALLTLSLVLAPCLPDQDVWAQFGASVVVDPTNLVQTTLTAVRTLQVATNTAKEVINTTRMVAGQVQQLQNDATNLLRSPFSIAADVLRLGQQITRALDVQGTVSFETAQALSTFQQYYPRVQRLVTTSEALAMRQTWTDHQRQALETSVLTQSVLTQMTQLIAEACRLLNSTDTARGALEIAQIQAMQNGLQHHMTQQQTQMDAAVERQKALKDAEELALKEAAIFAHQEAHKPFVTTYQPQGRLADFTQR